MSVFSEEWHACLREQYRHVVCTDDRVTRRSLTDVMLSVGFTEDELAQLRLEATMRVEDMPDDFVPAPDILEPRNTPQGETESDQGFQPHPLECQCPACAEIEVGPHDEESQPIDVTGEEGWGSLGDEDEDTESPQQMTMF